MKENNSNIQKALWGDPKKLLKIGDINVECYVLEDGTRVLSGRGMQNAIGFGQGEKNRVHGSKLKSFLKKTEINPLISSDLARAFESPKRFIRPGRGGSPAIAFEATLLIDLCDVIIDAGNQGMLKDSLWLMRQAQVITSSFAKTGLIAAIDEVTGYQYIREKDALQKILNSFLQDYARKWSKTFPDSFWDKLLKTKGYSSYIGLPRPKFIGHWVNDLVYDRLAPGIRKKLQELNPKTNKGNRKNKHHQYLSDDTGVPELKEHIIKLMGFMDAAANNNQFQRMVERALPKYGETIQLPLE